MNANQGACVETNDDVDLLVDTLIADPGRADDVKAALKRRITRPQVVDLRRAVREASPKAVDEDDVADLWDNVPV